MAPEQFTPEAVSFTQPVLSDEFLARFDDFAATVQAHDGTPAFSEQTRIELSKALATHDAVPPRVFVLERAGYLAAVLVAVPASGGQQDTVPGVIEAAVHPDARGVHLGQEFFELAIAELGAEASLYNLWVHGSAQDTGIESPANALAKAEGFKPVRVLYKMVLPLDPQTRENLVEASDARQLPNDLLLRTYTRDDEQPWLRVNAQAFAHHPEQGRLTLADLRERTGADWFRPEGFFIASDRENPSSIAAFTWTKIPRSQPAMALSPAGEIYVVGVSPSAQGGGLGRTLVLRGLAYLALAHDEHNVPLRSIELYVDADNTPAVALYESLGFAVATIDRMYAPARPASGE